MNPAIIFAETSGLGLLDTVRMVMKCILCRVYDYLRVSFTLNVFGGKLWPLIFLVELPNGIP